MWSWYIVKTLLIYKWGSANEGISWAHTSIRPLGQAASLQTDKKSFEFNLESNGRLQQPMKFEIRDCKYGGYFLYEESDDCLITLGDIILYKANYKSESCCSQNEYYFYYHGIKNALCGKPYYFPLIIRRLVVIQMK